MEVTARSWKKLLLFCIGLAVGSAFCMKWMETAFWSNGEKFTIIGLELFYPKEKMIDVLSDLDAHVKTILRYHLSFDFAFMAGVYPGITSLCMMARHKVRANGLRRMLFILALCQLLAWVADIIENYYLLEWTAHPAIGNDFTFYHFVVWMKWSIALTGILVSLPFIFRNKISPVKIKLHFFF